MPCTLAPRLRPATRSGGDQHQTRAWLRVGVAPSTCEVPAHKELHPSRATEPPFGWHPVELQYPTPAQIRSEPIASVVENAFVSDHAQLTCTFDAKDSRIETARLRRNDPPELYPLGDRLSPNGDTWTLTLRSAPHWRTSRRGRKGPVCQEAESVGQSFNSTFSATKLRVENA